MDFECPVQVKFFSFRDRNLLLIANDEQDTSRVRVVISAQLNKTAEAYVGQIIRDEGGHELQLTNGPVACSVK